MFNSSLLLGYNTRHNLFTKSDNAASTYKIYRRIGAKLVPVPTIGTPYSSSSSSGEPKLFAPHQAARQENPSDFDLPSNTTGHSRGQACSPVRISSLRACSMTRRAARWAGKGQGHVRCAGGVVPISSSDDSLPVSLFHCSYATSGGSRTTTPLTLPPIIPSCFPIGYS